MRRLATILAATVLVGCQGFNLPITGAGTRYGQLNFTPASQNSLQLISSKNGEERAAAPTAASGAAGDMAVGAPAMAMPAPMPYYFGGSYWGSEYELVSTSEAKAAGFQGTYQQTMDSVVKPMVAEWASDAVLRSAGGLTDGTGVNVKPSPVPSASIDPLATPSAATSGPAVDVGLTKPAIMPVYYQPTGWRFEFGSRAKRETLYFYVTADSTLVVKQSYRERVQDLSGAKLNSAEVVALVTKAIQDKSITANDPYQQALAGGGGVAVAMPAVAPMPAPAPATTTVNATEPGVKPAPDATPSPMVMPERPSMPSEEELTTVPANARWDLSLNLEYLPTQTKSDGTNPTPMQTRLVWNVSMQMDYSNQTPETSISGAWARVDAATGALLSLNRPRKYTHYVRPVDAPPPYPVPMPAGSAGSSGSGTTPAGTAVSAGPAPVK